MSYQSVNEIVNNTVGFNDARVFYRDFVNNPVLNSDSGVQLSFLRASSGTYLNKSGAIAYAAVNEPRFEYNGSGTCLCLLIEESRTNLVQNTSYYQANSTLISGNYALAPDGTITASRIGNTPSVSSYFRYFSGNAATSSGQYTLSFFAKADDANSLVFIEGAINDSVIGNKLSANINLSTSGFTFAGPTTITGRIDYPNGWSRYYLTDTLTGTSTNQVIYIGAYGNTPIQNWCLFWGFQLERGAFPTSFIPTTGSSVTRAQDFPSLSSGEWYKIFNPFQGGFLVEGKGGRESNQNGYGRFIGWGGSTAINRIPGTDMQWWNESSPTINFGTTGDPAVYLTRTAITYSGNLRKGSSQGRPVISATNGINIPKVREGLGLGYSLGFTSPALNGYISQVAYYNQFLSDNTLITLSR